MIEMPIGAEYVFSEIHKLLQRFKSRVSEFLVQSGFYGLVQNSSEDQISKPRRVVN
jgi:hypothetical protein